MEQYKSNVAAVMGYLKTEGFSASTISLHKLCYQGLEEFLVATGQPYSFDIACQWIEANRPFWDYKKYTGYKHCIQQLDDVCRTGGILADHLCFRKPPYDLLCADFRGILYETVIFSRQNYEALKDIKRGQTYMDKDDSLLLDHMFAIIGLSGNGKRSLTVPFAWSIILELFTKNSLGI